MKTELFQSCGHCWVFQICWHVECSTLTASSFRIWNSSTGIPSFPLALLVVMLPKALLTSHSRMSDSKWKTTSSWLSRSLRSFLYTVLLCILFISSWSLLLHLGLSYFCPLLCPSLDKMFLWYFQFSWRDLLFSSISLHCSLKKAFLSLLAILWNSAFSCVYLTVSPLLSILSFLQLFVNPPLEGFPNLENPAVATGLKRSILIPVPKKGSTKECLNLRTFSLISHASKVMLKMLHARLQHYVNWALSDVQVGFRWGRGTRYQDCLHWLDHRESKGIPE